MSHATLTETLNTFPGGLLLTDTDSKVVYASSALERRTGFSVAEIVGKKPGQLWGGKMSRAFYTSLWQTIRTHQQPFVGEVHNTKKNGAKHDEHIFILPIVDTAGVTRYFAEIHPDLADRAAEVTFGHEFLLRASQGVNDQDFFSWVFQVLKRDRFAAVRGSEPLLWQQSFENPAQFFEEALVAPMERTFVRRREDALLIAEAQANPERFAYLYEKYVGHIREYFLRRLEQNVPLAEDLTQEVFVRAFRYIAGFRMMNASYYTYLLRVAHSVLVNHYRKQSCETVSLSGNEGEEVLVESHPTSPDLDTLLAPLSPLERQIMVWKYREGLKIKAIAERVGKSENAVKLILSRTRKKLKKSLG